MGRKILVCMDHNKAILMESAANTAPRWTGKPGDSPDSRRRLGKQDDLRDFWNRHERCAIRQMDLV
jgi:hypothetical protein